MTAELKTRVVELPGKKRRGAFSQQNQQDEANEAPLAKSNDVTSALRIQTLNH